MEYFILTYRTNYGSKTSIIKAPNKEKAEEIADETPGIWSDYQIENLKDLAANQMGEIYQTP